MCSQASKDKTDKMLSLLSGSQLPNPAEFKELVSCIDSHTILAKVFLLEGTPFVFQTSPMKYVIFREQVAERFGVGSQDVCIVGSAKLGFSPSPTEKFGRPFADLSDVDVVVISDKWFHIGANELFGQINSMFMKGTISSGDRIVKDAIRNFVFGNFNPGLLRDTNSVKSSSLKNEIFFKISSTAGLFLALEPQVFVSKIRCRFFKSWKAAEDYYSNSLNELSKFITSGEAGLTDTDTEVEIEDELTNDISIAANETEVKLEERAHVE